MQKDENEKSRIFLSTEFTEITKTACTSVRNTHTYTHAHTYIHEAKIDIGKYDKRYSRSYVGGLSYWRIT